MSSTTVRDSTRCPEKPEGISYSQARRVAPAEPERHSPISFAAVAHPNHLDAIIAPPAVDKAPVAHAEAKQRRVEAFQLFHVARIGLQKAIQRFEKPQGGITRSMARRSARASVDQITGWAISD